MILSGFAQINITGNLEKDQEILLYGMAGSVCVIILSMLIVLVVVIKRRKKRNAPKEQHSIIEANDSAEKTTPPVFEKNEPATVKESTELKQEIQAAPVKEEKEREAALAIPEKETVQEERIFSPEKTQPQVTSPQSYEDKMAEVLKRIEEIKQNKDTSEPAIILPKIEAALPKETPKTETAPDSSEDIPADDQVNPSETEPEPDEIIHTSVLPTEHSILSDNQKLEEKLTMAPTEAETFPEDTPRLANGKFLPMKKMTFAEWVDLFKSPRG